jgi:hypothetical protein
MSGTFWISSGKLETGTFLRSDWLYEAKLTRRIMSTKEIFNVNNLPAIKV